MARMREQALKRVPQKEKLEPIQSARELSPHIFRVERNRIDLTMGIFGARGSLNSPESDIYSV